MIRDVPGLRRWLPALLLGWAASACGAPAPPSADGNHAVILLYHHVAEDTPSSTSVSPGTFRDHLRYLADHGYQVVPLSRVMAAFQGGESLPDRAVVITFDDAYASVGSTAAPMLERHGYPYTVFVSTDYIDQGLGNYLSWEALRDLEARGAEVGNHSSAHQHYLHRPRSESASAWRDRIAADIEAAQQRLTDELEQPLQALAYPYGEFNPALTDIAADLDYVGFGQQSGPAGPGSDLRALPRFPMASGYADLDSLAEKLRTRPFRVEVLGPDDPVLDPDADAPTLRLELHAPDARLDALSCFVTGQSAPQVEWSDRAGGVVNVTAAQPLPVGRSKYTCTAPATSGGGMFYWYSHLWMKPPAAGEWYRD